ncbi:MAG: DUF554 domain-containing protein [Saprospiraceae bacterium]|nr:DUF554 domain-containing protein [Saprospiraceae bacterium]
MTSRLPLGTLFNVLTVIVGSLIGLLLQHVFTPNMQEIVFQAVGLGTVLIALKMMWRLPEGKMLIFLFALILGGLTGEIIGLETFFENISNYVKSLIGNRDSSFSEGLITAFLLYCVGSMTIVGSIEEGISGKKDLLVVKSVLDGFSSIALASTYGVGVAFSVIPLFIFQGSLTVLAKKGKTFFDPVTVDVLSAIGGALIFGIAINLLNIGNIRVENLLPALVVGVVMVKVSPWVKGKFG